MSTMIQCDGCKKLMYADSRSDKGIPGWNKVLYDKETRVMYVNTEGGICVMLNADGTPKLYAQE